MSPTYGIFGILQPHQFLLWGFTIASLPIGNAQSADDVSRVLDLQEHAVCPETSI